MDLWVIDYALHVEAMHEAEFSRDEVAGFSNAVDACLAARGFERLERLGLHASAKLEALSDAHLACFDLSAIAGSDRFISKLNLFRVKDLNNLLPVLSAAKSASERIREQIDDEFSSNVAGPDSTSGITAASAVAAVIQDLFLDGTGQVEHKPHIPPGRRSPAARTS